MKTTVTMRDEFPIGTIGADANLTLTLAGGRISVRDLICARVQQEVDDYNSRRPGVFNGLVQPGDAERTLNGFKLPARRQIDAEEQCRQALAAFERNGFLLLVDDRQVDDLDALVAITPDTVVTFLKLVPLVGG